MNNTQRKMLNESFLGDMAIQEKLILRERAEEYEKLKKDVVAKETHTRNIKNMLAARDKFYELLENVQPELQEKGLRLNNLPYDQKKPLLCLSESYNSTLHPTLKAHKDETDMMRSAIESKRREITGLIYGFDGTYDELTKRVDEALNT